MKLVSILCDFHIFGGAQNVAIQIAKSMSDGESCPIILTDTPKENIFKDYQKMDIDFRPFSWKEVWRLSREEDVIFLSHHRKYTTILILLLGLLGKTNRLVHLSHNVFGTLKRFTLFPKRCIAVSRTVRGNLESYFGVPSEHIKVIYNGISDKFNGFPRKDVDQSTIKILLPARISEEKQQLKLVEELNGKIPDNIQIHFAGSGSGYEALKLAVQGSKHFVALGYVHVESLIYEYDYIMLFSRNEGLGLALIEGLMAGIPLITNALPVFGEVNEPGRTGYMFEDFDALAKGLSTLAKPSSELYKGMSINARARYESMFTEEKMLADYRRYLEAVLLDAK